uniref:Uncharacterized protein n=1 Tax=Anguilla anguilla TaxID=7936 RepID=A0A0E9T1Y2_ANGAN
MTMPDFIQTQSGDPLP